MRERRTLLLMCALAFVVASEAPAATLEVGVFSRQPPGGAVPEGWERWLPATTSKLTRWKLVREGKTTRLRAISKGTASGLVRRVTVDLEATPLLAWSWRLLEHPEGADLGRAGGDDAAARVCALFGDPGTTKPEAAAAATSDFGEALPALSGEPRAASALCYAWVATGKSDAVLTSPSSPQVRNLTVEVSHVHREVREERDLAADFSHAFGSPPGPLLAVALFTDSDATGGVASAYFGDVMLLQR